MSTLFNILLVEDTESVIELVEEALQEISISCKLHVARNGEEGLDFLARRGKHSQVPRPQIILLDSALPRMSGDEFLLTVKNSSRFKRIPVIILTTSDNPSNVLKYYDLHANCYIVKSADVEKFIKDINTLIFFWLETVTLPPL